MDFQRRYSRIVKVILTILGLSLIIYGNDKEVLFLFFSGLALILVLLFSEFIRIGRSGTYTKEKSLFKNAKKIQSFSLSNKTSTTFKLLLEKQNQLEALKKASEKFNSTMDLNSIVNYIYEVFQKFTGCDRCLICFKNINTQDLYCRYELGASTLGEVGKYFGIDSVVSRCFHTNSPVIRCNVRLDSRDMAGDKLAIPLNISSEQIGVIFLETTDINRFKKANLNFLGSVANYAAVAMDKSQLFNNVYAQKQEILALYEVTSAVNEDLNKNIESLNKAKEELKLKNEILNEGYFRTVTSLVNAIEAKDPYTSGHCQRVMEISCEIAKYMNLSEDTIRDLRYAAILHDIGKIGISATLLNKKEPLNHDEMSEIKRHPLISYNILKDVGFLGDGLRAILEHHEKFNGGGYPMGLKAKEISLLGRILCISDAFDAMTSDRTYRKAMSMEAAINEIENYSGVQFDPEISGIFVKMIRELIRN